MLRVSRTLVASSLVQGVHSIMCFCSHSGHDRRSVQARPGPRYTWYIPPWCCRCSCDEAHGSHWIVTEGALHLSSEYLRLFAIEAFQRSVELAQVEQKDLDMVRLGGADKSNGPVQMRVSSFSSMTPGNDGSQN